MRRQRYVTREFKQFTVQGSLYNEFTGECTSFYSDYIASSYELEHAKMVIEGYMDEGCHVTFLKCVGEKPILVGMKEEEFIEQSVLFNRKKNKPLESEEE